MIVIIHSPFPRRWDSKCSLKRESKSSIVKVQVSFVKVEVSFQTSPLNSLATHVMSHVTMWMSHVAHQNESCHAFEVCDMTHSRAWHDSWQALPVSDVQRLQTRDMTHIDVRRDSFTCVTWLMTGVAGECKLSWASSKSKSFLIPATISGLLKIIGLFCRIWCLL